MKTHNNLYFYICSLENLRLAFEKASKGKSHKKYVIEFEKHLEEEIAQLKCELESFTYHPKPHHRFVVRDPKTRTIHASAFRDRVVYHALVNILEPIFEKIFIYDSYASRRNKGTLKAVLRFESFLRKVSNNGRLVKNPFSRNNITGYVLKADIKHYFETVDHTVLLDLIQRKIKDKQVIWLIEKILANYEGKIAGKGMPLGNLTSQFFANIYLTELDYFVKPFLKIKYYIRYVDDFVILDKEKSKLEICKQQIDTYLKEHLKLSLHPDKSRIVPLKNGTTFLGYRVFYYCRLLRKRNKKKFDRKLDLKLELYQDGFYQKEELIESLQGWFGYAMWANTYNMRKDIIKSIEDAK